MHATKGHLQEVSRHYYSQSFINLTFTYFEISKYKKQYLRKIITNILTCGNLNKKYQQILCIKGCVPLERLVFT